MTTYEITVRLDNSYEVVETIEAKADHLAITQARGIIKEKYQPDTIWFIDLKKK